MTIIAVEALTLILWGSRHSAFIESHYGIGLTDGYNTLGRMLFEGHGYRFRLNTGPTLRREPGFPLLIAATYTLFGRGLLQVRLVNLFAAGLAAGLLSRMAARASPGSGAPLLAPLLFLLHPGILVAELRMGVEIPFLLLALCFLHVLDLANESRKQTAYAAAGLVLGLASLLRSTALLFPLLLPFYFFLTFDGARRPSILVMSARVLVLLAAAFLVLTPWMIRNYRLVGTPIATASIMGTAVHTGQYICRRLNFHTELQALDYAAGDERVQLARQQGYRVIPGQDPIFYDPHDEVQFSDWLTRRVFAEYWRSPLLFAQCAGQNVFNYWFAGKNWTSTLLNIPLQLAYLVIAIWGGIVYTRTREALPQAPGGIGLYVLFCIYSMLVYVPTFAQARYSIPTVPLLALIGAVGIAATRRAPGRSIGSDSAGAARSSENISAP